VLVLFCAFVLDRGLKAGGDLRATLLPVGVVTALFGLLISLQPDLGSVVVLGLVAGTLLFLTGLPWKLILPTAGAALLLVAILILAFPYRLQRIAVFLHPDMDPRGSGFQASQSLIAVGSGGLFGKWFDGSSQKLLFLPHPHTDFIYSMVGETFGLVGCLLLLGLFVWFLWRGVRAVEGAPDAFGTLAAAGIVAWIFGQALIHILVTLCLIPTKGMPLPLFSYGGSSLVVTLSGLGILLNISQHE
jgi:cell division protein FtsW